jgi:hypothetical protein
VVEAEAVTTTGLGWTYAPAAAASLVQDVLAPVVGAVRCLCDRGAHRAMRIALRNAGDRGLGAMALSAVDVRSGT